VVLLLAPLAAEGQGDRTRPAVQRLAAEVDAGDVLLLDRVLVGAVLGRDIGQRRVAGRWPPKTLIGTQPLARAIGSAQTIWPLTVVAWMAAL
jgi:hypothetical protein